MLHFPCFYSRTAPFITWVMFYYFFYPLDTFTSRIVNCAIFKTTLIVIVLPAIPFKYWTISEIEIFGGADTNR